MDRDDAGWVAWTHEHRVAYEVEPLVEAVDGGGVVRSGFSLFLYAASPAPLLSPEGDAAGDALRAELGELAAAAIREIDGATEMAPDSPPEEVFRPENRLQPEVEMSWRIVHVGEPRSVTEADRAQVERVERRLAALGARRGTW